MDLIATATCWYYAFINFFHNTDAIKYVNATQLHLRKIVYICTFKHEQDKIIIHLNLTYMITRVFQLISLVFLIGCLNEDPDISAPTMEVVEYIPTPTEDSICGAIEPVVFNLRGGEEFTFDVIFNDDQALSQYKVDIHNNFDCHGHGGGSAPSVAVPNVNNLTTDWTVLDIHSLSGDMAPIIWTDKVPENVTAGNYHFHLQVIDEAGNDSPFANFHSMKIYNPLDSIAPQINIQEPAIRNMAIKKGERIRFVGQVTDNRSLSDGGNGVLYLAYTDLSTGNTFATDKAFIFDVNVDTNYDFDFEFEIPQTLVSGDYRLSLGANDGVRNVAAFEFFDVQVSN